jgi:hypothetical protein
MTMDEPVPREILFVETDTALLMFESATDAERALDPGDVEAGCHPCAYGRNGELHRIRCVGDRVVIEATTENRPDALKDLLLHYFEECEDPADATEPLDTLVERAWSIECDYRHRCGGSEPDRGKLVLWLIIALLIALGWGLNSLLR